MNTTPVNPNIGSTTTTAVLSAQGQAIADGKKVLHGTVSDRVLGMCDLRRRAREGGSYLVRASLARDCCWVQDFGRFPDREVRGAGLPESMMTAPGLQARIRPEFDLPLVTASGPLGEVSVAPPQVEFSEFRLGPRFSGEPNGASKQDASVFTQEMPEKQGER
jgi:hypothetical protein